MADKANSDTSSFESQFAQRVVSARWRVIAATLALVALATSGVQFLTLSTNYRMFFDENNPELQAFDALEAAYGKSDSVIFVVAPEDGDTFSREALAATLWLTERGWHVPYSTRVDSLANFQHTTVVDDDLSVSDFVKSEMLDSADERNRIRETALSDPRLVGNLLARDGGVSAVQVTVALPEEAQVIRVPEIEAFSRALAVKTEEKFPGIDIRLVGTVIISHAFAQAALDSQKIFIPLCFLIMALVLTVLTRRLSGVVGIMIMMILSVISAMGLGGWVGLPFSPFVSAAPTIILMIVVANCVHLLVTAQQRLKAGDSKDIAIAEAIRVNLYPIFLASATTALGFFSLNFAEVPPHRHLGTFVGFGILVSFALSVTLLPALLSLFPIRASKEKSAEHHDALMGMISEFVLGNQKALLFGLFGVVLAMAAVIPRNELNDVMVHFFDERMEFRQDTDFVDENLSGNTVLEYSVISPDGITSPTFLSDVSDFTAWLRDQPEVRHVGVITDTFKHINQIMHGGASEAYRLPESRDLTAQYMLLYELSLPFGLDLNNQVDLDRVSARVTVTAETLSSQEVLALDRRAEDWLRDNTAYVNEAKGSGPSLLFAHMGLRNIKSMLGGTALVLLGISLILILAFRSFRLGTVSLVPNFVPAVIGFGVWGLTVGEIGASLSVVVAMTVGIVVDDTVHFLSKYQRARLEYGFSPEDAVSHAFQTVGRAVFTTTLVLVAGFLILLLAPFIPTAQVGLLTALIIGFALVFDFLLLPPLLIATDRYAQASPTATG